MGDGRGTDGTAGYEKSRSVRAAPRDRNRRRPCRRGASCCGEFSEIRRLQSDVIRALSVNTRPRLVDTRFRVGGHSVPTGDHSPPVGCHSPPVGDHSPPVGDHSPPVDDDTPPVGDHSPPVGDHSPPVPDDPDPVEFEERRISFQSLGQTPPDGWETDFGTQRSYRRYGWVATGPDFKNRQCGRRRQVSDVAADTFCHAQGTYVSARHRVALY